MHARMCSTSTEPSWGPAGARSEGGGGGGGQTAVRGACKTSRQHGRRPQQARAAPQRSTLQLQQRSLTRVAALHLGRRRGLGGGHIADQHVDQAARVAEDLAARVKRKEGGVGGGHEGACWNSKPPGQLFDNLEHNSSGTQSRAASHQQASLMSGLTSMPYEAGRSDTPNSSITARTLRSSSPRICEGVETSGAVGE